MLTKRDLSLIENLIDVKFDEKFDEAFDRKFDEKFDAAFDRKFDEKFDAAFDRKFDEHLLEIRDMIAGFKDEILTVLRPLQEDHIVLSHRSAWHTDQVESLDVRLTHLEKKTLGIV
jgi:hypothetical protein